MKCKSNKAFLNWKNKYYLNMISSLSPWNKIGDREKYHSNKEDDNVCCWMHDEYMCFQFVAMSIKCNFQVNMKMIDGTENIVVFKKSGVVETHNKSTSNEKFDVSSTYSTLLLYPLYGKKHEVTLSC